MAYIITPDLGLELADPATIQAFETPVVNENFLKLEAAIVGTSGLIKRVADLNALATLSLTGITAGTVVEVVEMRALFMRNAAGSAWEQITPATFGSETARNNAYAKASAAYRVNGARVFRTDLNRYQTYYVVSATRTVEGWQGDIVHAEYTYSHSITNGGTASGDLVLVPSKSSEEVANAFLANANGFAVRNSGVYEIAHTFLSPGNITGLSFLYFAEAGGEQWRAPVQTGDVRGSVSAVTYLPANTNIVVGQQQTSGATRTITGRLAATFLGGR